MSILGASKQRNSRPISVLSKPDLTYRRTFAKHVWSFRVLCSSACWSPRDSFVVAGHLWEFDMAHSQEQALTVLNPVTDYEKIKRVGEGTYGVVCMLRAFLHMYSLSDLLLDKH